MEFLTPTLIYLCFSGSGCLSPYLPSLENDTFQIVGWDGKHVPGNEVNKGHSLEL